MHYTVTVEKMFSAAHALRGYQGKCENLHGHNWKIAVALKSATLNKIGMVVDFTEIKILLDKILKKMDHTCLNEVPPFTKKNPTAEHIARYVYGELQLSMNITRSSRVQIKQVMVWESETSCATYGA